ALLLLFASVAHQHLGISGVRRATVERLGRKEAPAHDLGEWRVVAVVEAGALLAVGEEEVPEARGLRLALKLLDDRRYPPLSPVLGASELVDVGLLVREDALAHEALDLTDEVLRTLGMLEVHRVP